MQHKVRLMVVLAALLLLISTGIHAQGSPVPLPGRVTTPAHYLVIQTDAQGQLQVIHHQKVTLSGVMTSLSDAQIRAQTRQLDRMSDAVTVRLLNSAGQVVYQTVQRVDGWLRGEFLIDPANPNLTRNGTNIDGHLIPRARRSFVIRVPDFGAGTALQITPDYGAQRTTRLNLDTVAAQFIGKAVAPRSTSITGWDHGDPANRVDVLVMGDGYIASQEATFNTDALDLANGWGSIQPYQDYANYVNMRSLFTASNQSGADQPNCPTDPAPGGEDNNTFVDTAFDATFCSFGIWRLLTVDDNKVFTAAAGEPDWDHIFVVVNTSIYGGAGGQVAVVSTNINSVDVLRHEYGHSFTGLADEYTSPYPGFPACSDTDGSSANDCEANVTDVTTLANLKWDYWVAGGTPIPTTGPLADPEGAGLWEGARYLTSGMYRQCYACLMNYLGYPFGHVASEAYVLRLYNGGWGVPAGGISNIEPGTVLPASDTVNIPLSGSQEFSAQILSPSTALDATVNWYINGALVDSGTAASGDTASYTVQGTTEDSFTLTLEVIDNSLVIHSSNRAGLASTHSWQVNIGSAQGLLYNGGMETDANADKIPDGWTGKALTKDKIKCDSETKVVAYSGSCAFMFKGGVGEGSSISQIIPLEGKTFTAGDSLTLGSYVYAKSASVSGKLKLKVVYSDETTAQKLILAYTFSDAYSALSDSLALDSGAVQKIKLQAANSSPSGKVFLDEVSLVQVPAALKSVALAPVPSGLSSRK